jgi:integrase/recombinase XerD
VRVLHGKGNKTRITGIDEGAIAMLQEWLTARQRWGVNGSHVVFCTRTGRPLIDGFVRRWFSQLAKKAGILKRVHAHGFRHTHAAELRSEGVDIGIISKQLGHASISTTARYLDHIARRQVVNTIRARTW